MPRIKLVDMKKPENDTEPASEERNYFWWWVAAVAVCNFTYDSMYHLIRWDIPGAWEGAIVGTFLGAYILVRIAYWLSSKL